MRQILSATKYIHTLKVLHLDITPSNVLIKKGTNQAILIDFGAALTYGGDNRVQGTTSKLVTGMKKHFAPNEQSDIDNLMNFDATFDTYAIGATFYFLLTGQKPPLSSMVGTGRGENCTTIQNYARGEISDYLDAIILKAMAPKFFERIASVAEFEKMLAKENDYNTRLQNLTKKVGGGYSDVALVELIKMEEKFLPTETLSDLKSKFNPNTQNNWRISRKKNIACTFQTAWHG